MHSKLFGDMPLFGKETVEHDPVIHPFLFVGFGLHLFWLCGVLFHLFPSSYLQDPTVARLYSDVLTLAIVFAIAVMLGLGWTLNTISYRIRLRHIQIGIGISMVVGTALLYLSQYLIFIPLCVIGGLLTGMSSGFLTLIWAEAFRRRETISIVVNTTLSIVVFLTCFACLIAFVPHTLTGLVYCVVPVFSFCGLFIAMHGKSVFFSQQEFTIDSDGIKLPVFGIREIPTFRRLRVHKSHFIIRMGLPSFLMGLAFGPLAKQSTLLLDTTNSIDNSLIAPFAAACLSALLLIALLIILNRGGYHSFHRFIIPPLLVSILVTGFLPKGDAYTMFTLLSFIGMIFIIWTEFAELSHRYRISPILVSGFGLPFVFIGLLLSSILLDAVNELVPDGINSLYLSCVLLVLLSVGYFLLPNERIIKSMAILDIDKYSTRTDSMQKQPEGEGFYNRERFAVRCERVANTFLLTQRETDLLYLIAKGRDTAHIAKQLYISEGTVRTHTWHIYKKLNIHKQQELIDLIDSQNFDS